MNPQELAIRLKQTLEEMERCQRDFIEERLALIRNDGWCLLGVEPVTVHIREGETERMVSVAEIRVSASYPQDEPTVELRCLDGQVIPFDSLLNEVAQCRLFNATTSGFNFEQRVNLPEFAEAEDRLWTLLHQAWPEEPQRLEQTHQLEMMNLGVYGPRGYQAKIETIEITGLGHGSCAELQLMSGDRGISYTRGMVSQFSYLRVAVDAAVELLQARVLQQQQRPRGGGEDERLILLQDAAGTAYLAGHCELLIPVVLYSDRNAAETRAAEMAALRPDLRVQLSRAFVFESEAPVTKVHPYGSLEDMVQTAVDWRNATQAAAEDVSQDRKKAMEVMRLTTKSELDKYLRQVYDIDAVTAREVSNQLTSRNLPVTASSYMDPRYSGEEWAWVAAGYTGQEFEVAVTKEVVLITAVNSDNLLLVAGGQDDIFHLPRQTLSAQMATRIADELVADHPGFQSHLSLVPADGHQTVERRQETYEFSL